MFLEYLNIIILYINGFRVCELFKTIFREKSEVIKLNVKITKDKNINKKFMTEPFCRNFTTSLFVCLTL